jgi:hypothetical protein
LIVTTIWFFVGTAFTYRYLTPVWWISVLGGLLMAFIVVQIERQIILSTGKHILISAGSDESKSSKLPPGFWVRVFIGVLMAFIGSVILDQFIFREDIEKRKIETIIAEVDQILPSKTAIINEDIRKLEDAINEKEQERAAIIDEITKKPMISSISTTVKQSRSGTGRMGTVGREITTQSIPNPKVELIPQIDARISELRNEKRNKEEYRLNLRENVENELKSKKGFLDELTVMMNILTSSPAGLLVWLFFFLFFLLLELFVVIIKWRDEATDYDHMLLYQTEHKKRRLRAVFTSPSTQANRIG